MAQSFKPWANVAAKWGPPFLVLALMAGLTAVAGGIRSDYNTGVGMRIEQPVQFSHRHHVQGLGLDCRFCHTSVERSSFAGLPDTHTCMGCHSQIYPSAPMLAPVRESEGSGKPLHWNRVTLLPDHVFFNHQIHIAKGVGCVTCHGTVSEMPLTAKVHPFFMSECLHCHQNPERYLRPLSEIFNERWQAKDQHALGEKLRQQYGVHPEHLIQCSVCHR